ncbi:MAG: sugar ABC transporter substrate-binding protein, partial [Anaerolineae bacterium]
GQDDAATLAPEVRPLLEDTLAGIEVPPKVEEPEEPIEKAQIKLATWAGVDEANELQAILDELNATADTYEIVQESSPAEYWTKLQTTVAAGTAADLFWMDLGNLPDFAEKGALLELTDYLAASDHPAADLDDYFTGALDGFAFGGENYGLPWIAMPVMLYVNLDHAEAAGYDVETINDWDWDTFQEACVAMTMDGAGAHPGDDGFDATDVAQYGFSVVPGWPPVQMWVWQAGGEVISEDFASSPIDSPEAIQGAQYLGDLINKYLCAPEQSVISERGFGEMMKNGQVAMFMGGAADDFERTEGMNIKAFLLPQGPVNRQTWAWIGGMSIFSGTENPDAAVEAFLDLSQAIHEWKVPAPRESLATREGIIAATPYKEVSADNIVANMPHMRAARYYPGYSQWSTIYGERFVDPLVRGQDDAATLAPEVRPLLEDTLP